MSVFKYRKIFTRDHTLSLAESWYFAHDKGTRVWTRRKKPLTPPIIFYMFDGAIETWHSVDHYQWIQDALQKELANNKNLVNNAILKYEQKMARVKKNWKRKYLNSVKEFKCFISDYTLAVSFFPVWYYAAVDSRTLPGIRRKAVEIREKDLFYDANDRIIRSTYTHLYKNLKNFENVILKDEIDNPPPINILKKRKEHFVLIPGHIAEIITIRRFLRDNSNIKFISNVPKKNLRAYKIKGQVAFRGKAKGRVKVIRRLDQVNKIKGGDIMVSPMTSPNYLSAMKKSAAIITDEGGITCHAAIVAREMKKPCIIGTGKATQILKDGDLVEVDAEQGVVKKL